MNRPLFSKSFSLILMLALSVLGFAQTGKINGVIEDPKGNKLSDVKVLADGPTKGVAFSDVNGAYEITGLADGSYVLTLRLIGLEDMTLDVAISGGGTVTKNLVFGDNQKASDEVVVIGYGTTRTKDLTGAATIINEKNFLKGSLATPEQLLMGKVAGLKVTSNDGAPGSGSTLRLRGGTSINASNDPLIVVDGVPLDNGGISGAANPLSLINPNDIESFVVLKDASATAIYGSRAANGVIIITTKKGSANQNQVKVVLDSKTSLSTIAKYADVLTGDSLRALINRKGTAAQKALLGTANTDWQREVFRNAIVADNNISITGGIKGLPYRLSVGNRNENGLLKRDNMNRTSLSLNMTPSFLDGALQLEVNQKLVQSRAFFANRGALGAAFFDPTQPVYSGNDTQYGGYFEWIDNNKPNTLSGRNPLGLIMQSEDRSVVNRYIGNAKVSYKMPFLPQLKAVVNVGTDQSEGIGYTETQATSAAGYFSQGSYSQYRQTKGNKLIEAYVNYNSGDKLKNQILDITAGYSYQDWYTSSPNNPTYNQAQDSVIALPAANPFYTKNALLSYYARAIYSVNDRYVLNVSMRRDGSSRFSPEQRWGWFPAASAAWIISQEKFMKDVKAINMLKVRAGWGVTGQQDGIGDYAYIGNYFEGGPTAQYAFGGQYYTVFRPAGFDANLKWETTTSYNIGLDFGLLKDRISGSIDVYKKLTSDLLATVAVPAGTNFTNQILTNVGGMENKGIEASLNLGIIAKKKVRLDWMVNATHNINQVTKLSQIEDPNSPGILVGGIAGGIGNQVLIHQVAYPTFTYFLYEQQYDTDGSLIEVGQQASIDMNGDGNITATDKWKDTNAFVDRNNDGVINVKDRYYAGQVAPKIFLGTALNFQYGKWYAGVSMRSELGATIYNNIHSNSGTFTAVEGTKKYLNNISSLYYEDEVQKTTTNQLLSDHYLEKANFLRVDNINVGYNFGKLGFTKNKIGLNAGFSVQNVFVVTKYSGQDPEVGGGVDNNFYPRPRVYTLNLTFDF
jgi:TonB-dependent starch-binding outer membrane protein SusC